MITIISRHYCKAEKLDESKQLLNKAGFAQSKFRGFLSRQTLQSQVNHLELVTLTSWESKDDQQQWFNSEERQQTTGPSKTGSFWEKPPEQEFLNILG